MSDTSTIKGLERGRAKFAYECAKEGKKLENGDDKKYKSYVKNIPMLIKTNGLGPTFAFLFSKSDDAYDLIYKQIKGWLNKDEKQLVKIENGEDLVEKIVSLESPEYRAATIEVLSLFNWLRRFADGLIEGDGENESER